MFTDLSFRYKVWLKQASFDLEAAHTSFNAGHYEWACYQTNQAVEKAFKAIVVHAGYRPPQTHKLGILLGIANRANNSFKSIELNFRKIESYTFIARYPFVVPGRNNTPHEFIDKQDATACISLATDILEKIELFLSSHRLGKDKNLNLADYYYTKEEVEKRISTIVELIKTATQIKVKKIILFGGFAREKTRPKTSTMDILVVGETDLKFIDRIQFVRELTKGSEPIIEPLVYTSSEFDYLLKEEGEGFLESALEEGDVIYEE